MTNTVDVPNVARAIETVSSHLHPTPSWQHEDHPMPTGREEVWRFTPIKRFSALLKEQDEISGLAWDHVGLSDHVTISQISADEARELAVEAPVDRISSQAVHSASQRTLIDVAAEAELKEPIVLTGTGQGGEVRDHYVIRIGNHAHVTLVLRFTGVANFAEKCDVIVGDGAHLNLVTIQDWDVEAVHGGHRSVLIGRDAYVKTVTASLGGHIRLQENFTYTGPGGELEAFGLYFSDNGEHIQHRLFVDHNKPSCKSNVDYRGALRGETSHAVWIGDVLIRKEAEGIGTYESNKNLLLTDGCRADSVPNLEIETGEIEEAGHSSSTGRFDEEQVFYLMSRGVAEREARRLIVHGFFYDIIRRIGVSDIEAEMLQQVEKELDMLEAAQGVA